MAEKSQNALLSHWPLLVGCVTVAAMWGTLTAQVSAISGGQGEVLRKLDKQAEQLSGFQVSMAASQATQGANGQQIANLRDRLERLEARR